MNENEVTRNMQSDRQLLKNNQDAIGIFYDRELFSCDVTDDDFVACRHVDKSQITSPVSSCGQIREVSRKTQEAVLCTTSRLHDFLGSSTWENAPALEPASPGSSRGTSPGSRASVAPVPWQLPKLSL